MCESCWDVLGKYHPHGDQAVYDALVRLIQNFSTKYPTLDGHGNFGSVDNDPPAAMRYTETRLAPIAHKGFLEKLDQTINFQITLTAHKKNRCSSSPASIFIIERIIRDCCWNGNQYSPRLGEIVDGCISRK